MQKKERFPHLEMAHLLSKLGTSLYWLCSFFSQHLPQPQHL